ncbi:DUF4339 domain-containing protein [Endomicrobium sp. AH-315-J14]|nr:DUF4339 domain-containing protein [Endomicrobium sp. AH-315-J14]
MSTADQWRWTDEDGVQRLLRGDELRTALAEGRLHRETLVWRRGMKKWLPAGEVPELAEQLEITGETDGPTVPKQKAKPRPKNVVDIAALRGDKNPNDESRTMVSPLDAPPIVSKKKRKRKGPAGRRAKTNLDGMWGRSDDKEDTQTQTLVNTTGSLEEPAQRKKAGDMPASRPSWPEASTLSDESRTAPRTLDPDAPDSAPATRVVVSSSKGNGGVVTSAREPATVAEPTRRRGAKVRATMVSEQADASPPRKGKMKDSTLVSDARGTEGRKSTRGRKGRGYEPKVQVREKQAARKGIDGTLVEGKAPLPKAPRKKKVPGPPRNLERPSTPNLKDAGAENAAGPVAPPPADDAPFVNEPWAEGGGGAVALAEGAGRRPHSSKEIFPGGSPRSLWLRGNVAVQRSMVVVGAVVLLVLLVGAFIVGRVSSSSSSPAATESDSGEVVRARSGLAAVSLFTRATAASMPRACLMARAPEKLAGRAARSIPFEMSSTGSQLAIGFAARNDTPGGFSIDLETGEVGSRNQARAESFDLSRVVPLLEGDEVRYAATPVERDGVSGSVYVRAPKPFVVGFKDGQLIAFRPPNKKVLELWEISEDGTPDSIRAVVVPDKGVIVAYRQRTSIWVGWLELDGTKQSDPKRVDAPEQRIGTPSIAHNGRDVSLVFAQRPDSSSAPVIRWAHAPIGKLPVKTEVIDAPEGGPGGETIAPAIGGLADGRWLLMWTEGRRGNRILRAQTYSGGYNPIGGALRLSPSTGSFGQGSVGVSGQSALVAFLLRQRRGYQVWGTVLKCR